MHRKELILHEFFLFILGAIEEIAPPQEQGLNGLSKTISLSLVKEAIEDETLHIKFLLGEPTKREKGSFRVGGGGGGGGVLP